MVQARQRVVGLGGMILALGASGSVFDSRVGPSFYNKFFNRQCVRVVKEADLKSVGLCPRRFKSCHCRNLSVAQLVERQTVEVNSYLLVICSNQVAENSASARVV